MNSICEKYQARFIALLDGAIDQNASAEVREHIESCPECKNDLAWLECVSADLEAIGDKIIEEVPGIDVVRSVMGAVELQESRSRETHLKPIGPEKRSWWPMAFGMAVAATLLIGIGIGIGLRLQTDDNTIIIAKPVVPPVIIEKPDDLPTGEGAAERQNGFRKIPDTKPVIEPLPMLEESPREKPETDAGDKPDEDIEDRGERLQLAMLASYSDRLQERATNIADAVDTRIEAKVGASRHLPSEEAESILVAATEKYPDDPHIRYQLALNYAQSPETSADALAQLAILKELEVDNALPYYIEAKILMDQGDTNGALNSLDRAAELEHANAYAASAFRFNEEALIASGLSSEDARVDAAFSIGAYEYDELHELAIALMDFGEGFVDESPETARQVYESVDRMGEQLQTNPAHLEEGMAGADIQIMTEEPLENIYMSMGDQQALEDQESNLDRTALQVEFYTEVIKEVIEVASLPGADLFDIGESILLGGYAFLTNLAERAKEQYAQ